jgi:hypothetical protein
MKKEYIFISIIALVFILIGFDVLALPPGPPGGGGGPPCWPPPCNPIPIDGGLSYLLAAGAVLGGRKLYKMNQKG